jgi:hypothetical protein
VGRPEQIIPHHLIAIRDEYDRLIAERFACVSPKAVNQMRRALRQPANRFWTDILAPNLLLDASGQRHDQIDIAGAAALPLTCRPIHLPIADTVRTKGRNHKMGVWASRAEPAVVQGRISVFANTLRIGGQKEDGEWEKPSDRVVGAPYTIFTLEYDAPSEWDRDRRLRFLDTQLGWFRQSGSNDLDRPIRAVWEWAAQFSDFRGICANWSGNKSVHIHFAFDTSAVMREFPDLRDQVRRAYTRLWDQMAAGIARVFPQDIEPDSALQRPEQYRKLPNGAHTIEPGKGGPDHLLAIPAGTRVPQLCVWEKLLSRAPTKAVRAFVNEGVLKQYAAAGSREPRQYHRKSAVGTMTAADAEHAYCSEQFIAYVAKRAGPDGYPRGAGLYWESSGWVGRLYANETDRNPSTIIFEDSTRLHVQGGKEPNRDIRLGIPLRFLIRQWRGEYARLNGLPASFRRPVSIRSDPQPVERRPEEVDFSLAASSPEAARRKLEEMLPGILISHRDLLFRGQEGLGKTTAIARCLPELTRHLTRVALDAIPIEDRLKRDLEQRRPCAFAFSSYDLAEEKAEEFNKSAAAASLQAIVMKSFSKLYKESCEALGVEEVVTLRWAAERGDRSVAEAIRLRQPNVWAEMEQRHAQIFDRQTSLIGRHRRIVYFIVHQVLQQMTSNLMSAAFLHPSFFSTDPKDWWQLAKEMRFQVAVHDEIPTEALVVMHPAAQVEWCLALFRSAAEVWDGEEGTLADKFRTFEAKLRDDSIRIEFEEVFDIYRAGYRPEHATEVAEAESYGSGPLYTQTLGKRWYARKRNWRRGLADRTVLLTTEALPTEMARALDSEEGGIEVFDLRTELRIGQIQLRLWPSCSSKDAEKIVKRLREQVGDPKLEVVTNRAKGVEGTSTHAGVRGSNSMTGENLGQTAFYRPPEQYERLQIINRLFGLAAAIRLQHVDEINQTAGRNLGFRYDGVVDHHLVMGWLLYEEIESVLYSECRYGLTLVEDADQRRKDKAVEQRAAVRGARRTEEQIDALVEEQDWIEPTSGHDLVQTEVGVELDTANRAAVVEPTSTVVGVAGG